MPLGEEIGNVFFMKKRRKTFLCRFPTFFLCSLFVFFFVCVCVFFSVFFSLCFLMFCFKDSSGWIAVSGG